jgi:hypothetical protein
MALWGYSKRQTRVALVKPCYSIYLTAIGLSPGGSGYLHVYKYKKLIINKFTFKAGGLHEKHIVATWNLGNHLSIRL